MDLHQLRCFEAVADQLHFGRAAASLHLSPSPVSRAVKELEHFFGTDLFVRQHHQVLLTPAGTALATALPELLAMLDALPALVRAAAGDSVRVLRTGGTHLCPPALLEEFLGVARDAVPEVQVTMSVAPTPELATALSRGALDIALAHLPVPQAQFESVVIARFPFEIAMRADDELARREVLTVADMADRTIVIGAPDTPSVAYLRGQLARAGARTIQLMPDYDISRLAGYVRANAAVTLALPWSTGGSTRVYASGDFATVPLADEGLDFAISAVWRRSVGDDDRSLAAVVSAIRCRWSHPSGVETVS